MLVIIEDYTLTFRHIDNSVLTRGSIITKYFTKAYRDGTECYCFFIANYYSNIKKKWDYPEFILVSIPKNCAAILEGEALERVKLLYSIE